jgi:FHA domain
MSAPLNSLPAAWVEVLSTKGEVQQRFKLTHSPFLIGRSPQSDLLLDDPFLAAMHGQFEVNEQGNWTLKPLESKNGIQSVDAKRNETTANEYNLGQSRIRLRLADQPIAEERLLPIKVAPVPQRNLGRMLTLMALVFVAIELFGMYAATSGEYKPAAFISPILMFAGIVVAWSFVWSLLSRLFSGAPQFKEHLFIATCVLVGTSVLNELIDWIGYGLALPNVQSADSLMRYAGLAIGVFFHLRLVSPQRPWQKAAGVASFCLVAGGLYLALNLDRLKQTIDSSYATAAMHPAKQLKAASDSEAIVKNFGKVKEKLDQKRTEKPGDDDLDLFED